MIQLGLSGRYSTYSKLQQGPQTTKLTCDLLKIVHLRELVLESEDYYDLQIALRDCSVKPVAPDEPIPPLLARVRVQPLLKSYLHSSLTLLVEKSEVPLVLHQVSVGKQPIRLCIFLQYFQMSQDYLWRTLAHC